MIDDVSSGDVGIFLRQEVKDWDDESISTARFKAFSGQRSDFQPKYLFWRNLILRVSCHFNLFIINPSHVMNRWFNRQGLNPLCLDHVLSIMYDEGDIVRRGDLLDPTSGRLSQLFYRVRHMMVKPSASEIILEDNVILLPPLKGRADEVTKKLSECHWTSSCIITMKKFQIICGGSTEASVILTYLSGCGKARYLSISKTEFIEGVKVSLSNAAVSNTISLDYDVLHLIWTTEKLQQQLDVIDQRYEMSKRSALDSLSSGNKKVALRHARELKLTSESREKCSTLLSRVDEVLNAIANAESTKKVSEAIQIGTRAIKENQVSLEEVEHCLQELDETVDSQKQLENVLESIPIYAGIGDEDIEEEFNKLELEITSNTLQVPLPKTAVNSAAEEAVAFESSSDLLCDALSSLKIADGEAEDSEGSEPVPTTRSNGSKIRILEAA